LYCSKKNLKLEIVLFEDSKIKLYMMMKTPGYLVLLLTISFLLLSCGQKKRGLEQKEESVTIETYWTYDADREFTIEELYMMKDCGSCSEMKHFEPVTNTLEIPVLSDIYARNDKCAELYFPGCHYSTSENFCMKTMAQPGNQMQFPIGTDIYQAFSVFVPSDYSHKADWNVIYQFHGHPDGYPDDFGSCDNWRSPPFSIALNPDNWIVWGRYSKHKCDTEGNKSVTTMVLQDKQQVVKGAWTHFVIHIRFDYKGDGRCEVWLRDGENDKPKQIVDYTGSLGFNDEEPSYDYASFGYYYGNSEGPDVKLYFDRIVFAKPGKGETLEDLMYNK